MTEIAIKRTIRTNGREVKEHNTYCGIISVLDRLNTELGLKMISVRYS